MAFSDVTIRTDHYACPELDGQRFFVCYDVGIDIERYSDRLAVATKFIEALDKKLTAAGFETLGHFKFDYLCEEEVLIVALKKKNRNPVTEQSLNLAVLAVKNKLAVVERLKVAKDFVPSFA